MKYLALLILLYFSSLGLTQWNNWVPNYSMEVIDSDWPPSSPLPFTMTDLPYYGNPNGGNQMDQYSDYWALIPEWTHCLKKPLCFNIGGKDLLTPDIVEGDISGNDIEPLRGNSQYCLRAWGDFDQNGNDGPEVLVVPLEGAFDSSNPTFLDPAKTYYIEFYYTGDKTKKVFFNQNQPERCPSTNDFGDVALEFDNSSGVLLDKPTIASGSTIGDPFWYKYRGYFSPDDNDYKWMVIGAGGLFDDIKIYEVQDNFCQEGWYFDNTVFPYPIEIYQGSEYIIAGEDVDPEAGAVPGPVEVVQGSFTTFRAGNHIILKDGFSVDVGSGAFLAEIEGQPCKDLCPTPNLTPSQMCVSGPTKIGDSNAENTLVTASWSPTAYLDDPHSINPTFTPPPGAGDQIYMVTYYSNCLNNGTEDTVTVPVVVSYTNNPLQQPSLTVSNLVFDNRNLDANINVNNIIRKITFSYTDQNGVIQSFEIHRNNGIVNNTFHLDETFFPEASCCKDLDITITAQTYCGETVQTHIQWAKTGSFGLVGFLSNIFSPDGDGLNDECCIEVGELVCNYEIWVFDRRNNVIYHNSGPVIDNTHLCIWDGTKNQGFPSGPNTYMPDGEYFYKLELTNDCGDSEIHEELDVTILGSQALVINDSPDTDTPTTRQVKPKHYNQFQCRWDIHYF